MSEYLYTFTKYRFKGLPILVLSDDGVFYRLPFQKNGRSYGLKELKLKYHQGQNKLSYGGKRYTEAQLEYLKYDHKELIRKDKKKFYVPENLIEDDLSRILNTF